MLNDYSLDADEEKMKDKILNINYENVNSDILSDIKYHVNLQKKQIYWDDIEQFWVSDNKYPYLIINEKPWERLEEVSYL